MRAMADDQLPSQIWEKIAKAVIDLQDKLDKASRVEGVVGEIDSLQAVVHFLSLISSKDEHHHQRHFNNLISLLLSKKRSGKRGGQPNPISTEYAKALAIRVLERLVNDGMAQNVAYEKVADACRKAGLKPGRRGARDQCGEVTARTVRDWKAKISEDIGRHTLAGKCYENIGELPKVRPPDKDIAELQRFISEKLVSSSPKTT
jgi:hypothetical protein